jgi:hypothetical protein
MDSANALPTISRLTAEKTGDLTWRFSVNAEDVDDGITKYEWWNRSYNGGKNEPDTSGNVTDLEVTYTASMLCTVRVEAVDHYKAHAWATVVIKTDSGIVSEYNPLTTEKETPKDACLSNDIVVFPNPFNPQVEIFVGSEIGSVGNVCLEVFSMDGTLMCKKLLSGSKNSIIWNSVDRNGVPVSAGVYLFRVKAGLKSYSKKGILAR